MPIKIKDKNKPQPTTTPPPVTTTPAPQPEPFVLGAPKGTIGGDLQIAYGRGGTEPTVTDASLVLGYIDPGNFLGGDMQLDIEAARTAVRERVAEPLGMSPEAAAEAILVVASEEMRGLLTDMTVAQGRDARDCLMVAGGGAAGLNVIRIARETGVRHVLIPKLAAGLSALGGQYSDISAQFSRGRHTISSVFDHDGVNAALQEIGDEIDTFLAEVQHSGEQ